MFLIQCNEDHYPENYRKYSVVAIDTGEAMAEKISPFDTFIQVIEGAAEVVIDSKPNNLVTGQGIITCPYLQFCKGQ